MIKFSVLYPYRENFTFDFDYYVNHHIAIHKADPNVLGIIIEKGCNAFRGGDIPNFTNIIPIDQISEIEFLDLSTIL